MTRALIRTLELELMILLKVSSCMVDAWESDMNLSKICTTKEVLTILVSEAMISVIRRLVESASRSRHMKRR